MCPSFISDKFVTKFGDSPIFSPNLVKVSSPIQVNHWHYHHIWWKKFTKKITLFCPHFFTKCCTFLVTKWSESLIFSPNLVKNVSPNKSPTSQTPIITKFGEKNVTNILKHWNFHQIWWKFCHQGNHFFVIIKDDWWLSTKYKFFFKFFSLGDGYIGKGRIYRWYIRPQSDI